MSWRFDSYVRVIKAVDDVFRVGDLYARGDFATWLGEGAVPVGLRVRLTRGIPGDWEVVAGDGSGWPLAVRGDNGMVLSPDEFRCPPARNDTRARVLAAIVAYVDEHDAIPTQEEVAQRAGVSRPTVRYHHLIMVNGGLFTRSQQRGLSFPTAAGRRIARQESGADGALGG